MHPSKRMCGDAVAFLPLKRIITVLVFRCQTCDKQNKIYWLITSAGGHRWGRKLDFCICEERIAAKSHLLKLNPRKKCFFFVLLFRQHRGCPLCRKKKRNFIEKLVIGVSAASSPAL